MTITDGIESKLKSMAVWLILLAGAYVFWRYLLGYVLPFAVAFLLAVLLEPMVGRLQQMGLSRGRAVIAALLVGVGGMLGLFGALITLLVAELAQLTRSLPHNLRLWQASIDHLVLKMSQLRQGSSLGSRAFNGELQSVVRLLEHLLRAWLKTASHLPDYGLMCVVALVATFFFMRDRPFILHAVSRSLPPALRPRAGRMGHDIIWGVLGFIRAQLTLIALTALTTTVGLLIMQAKYAVLLGILAGLLDLVPFMGPTVLLVPWALVSLLQGHGAVALELMLVLAGVALVRQFIEPRLVGRSTGLHPLVVLFSLYAGIKLIGAGGLFAGPITAVTLKAMMSKPQGPDRPPINHPQRRIL